MSDADTMGMGEDEVAHLENVERAKQYDSYTADEVDAISGAVLRGLRGGTELEKNQLADKVAKMSRAANSPINAAHARADIDELLKQGMALRDLPAYYAKWYGVVA